MAKKTKKQIRKKQIVKMIKLTLFTIYHEVLPLVAILGLLCLVTYCGFGI